METRLPPRLAQSFLHLIPAGNIDKDTGDFVSPVTTSSLRIAREIVLHTDAISIGIRSQLADDIALDKLAVIDFHPPWLVNNYGFVIYATTVFARYDGFHGGNAGC